MRRVFSRSDLRKQALGKHDVPYFLDANRPRVTKWSFCNGCGCIEPRYTMEVDHVLPLVPLNKSLEDMTWDEVVDRLWCEISNLVPICKPCHKAKSKLEAQVRTQYKKVIKMQNALGESKIIIKAVK